MPAVELFRSLSLSDCRSRAGRTSCHEHGQPKRKQKIRRNERFVTFFALCTLMNMMMGPNSMEISGVCTVHYYQCDGQWVRLLS